ncbi:MAG: type VI secretion system baseplate subunit TssF, partial [Thiohalocapsa sp.]
MRPGALLVAARIHRKLDDDFPELTQGLLEVLYPHYLAPIPSMAIAKFAAVEGLSGPMELGAGVMLDVGPVKGEVCRYRTAYDVTLWPLAIETASLTPRPIIAPPNSAAPNAAAVLRISLRTSAENLPISALAPDRLRFFIQPQSPHAYRLYELILNHTISVGLANSPRDPAAVICDADVVRPVGFAEAEWLLPYPARSFVGYRLLTEFFAFPEKFLFFDVIGLRAKTLLSEDTGLDLLLYLDATNIELERAVSAQSLALGCTPIVNLFPLRAEPISIDQRAAEYRVVPDARRPGALEIYAINSVVSSAPDGRVDSYEPFFGLHRSVDATLARYWHAARRTAIDGATDMFLTFVDLDFDMAAPTDNIASVEAWCLNRDLPADLPFGGGNPHLELVEAFSAIESIGCLTQPTATVRPPLGAGTRWCLLSHLMLNHLTITGG